MVASWPGGKPALVRRAVMSATCFLRTSGLRVEVEIAHVQAAGGDLLGEEVVGHAHRRDPTSRLPALFVHK